MRRAAPLLFMVLLFPAPAGASELVAPPWATVNVCDTGEAPNQIGIRGAMAGLDRRARLFMRFRVQYRDPDDRWRLVRAGADSGWRRVASGRRATYDYGWSFTFKPPSSGGAHVLRGLVIVRVAPRRGGAAPRERRHRGRPPRDRRGRPGGVQLGDVRDRVAGPNSRGSFVITPVTPSASSRRIRAASSTVHT